VQPRRGPYRPDPEVALEGAFNVRDLGGLSVWRYGITTPGLAFRGDSLDSLSDRDRSMLFGDLGIGTILDLRTPEEAGGDGQSDARLFPALRVYSYPVIPDGRIGVEPFPVGDPGAIAEHYFEYVVDRAPIVAGAVEAIAESVSAGTPALFHCAAGRDRTGVVAAVLLALLGVNERDIVADYLASNRQAAEVSRQLALNPLYRGDAAAAAAGINLVDAGSIVSFLNYSDRDSQPAVWATMPASRDARLADRGDGHRTRLTRAGGTVPDHHPDSGPGRHCHRVLGRLRTSDSTERGGRWPWLDVWKSPHPFSHRAPGWD
jgi:hypothetical protein